MAAGFDEVPQLLCLYSVRTPSDTIKDLDHG